LAFGVRRKVLGGLHLDDHPVVDEHVDPLPGDVATLVCDIE
jgi:hypothetical protein